MRAVAAAVAAWVLGTAVLATLGWTERSYRDFDFLPFWLAGRGVLQGTDIYDPATVLVLFLREGSQGHALTPGTGFGYALPAAVLAAPFGALPFAVAAPAWAAAQLTLIGSGLWALGRTIFRTAPRRDLVLLLGLTAGGQPLWLALSIGQVGGFVLGIAAHATALLVGARPLAAGVVLGLLVLKPHLFLWAIPILLVASDRRRAIATGMLASAGSLVLALFLVRPDWPGAWLRSVGSLQGLNVSRANVWGIAPEDARWLAWVPLALLVAALVLWWRTQPTAHAVWAGALALSLLGAPYSWSHDYGLLAVPAAFVIGAVADDPPRIRVPLVAALAAAWVALPWLLYPDTYRSGEERAVALVPAVVLALVVAAHGIGRRARWHPSGRDGARPAGAVIPGVERRALAPHADARGTLRELWRRSRQPLDVRQVLVTTSRPGALRGMHYHLRQADLCYVAPGRVFMALVDLRSDPPVTEEFWLDGATSLLIPPGVAHGYASEGDATVTYLLTEEADGSDEFGFRFDDSAAGVHWPVARPVLSARDRDAGPFAAAHAAVRAHFRGSA